MKDGILMPCINSKPLEGNDVAPPLEEGTHYTIVSTHVCSCGQEHYDVGLKSEYNWVTCYKCKTKLPKGDQIHWCHPSRFSHE